MARTRKYKTLKGLLSQTLHECINFNNFHSGRFYHKKLGWNNFSLPEEEKQKAYLMFANAIYSKGGQYVKRLSSYGGKPWGILDQMILFKKYATLGGGQDWVRDCRIIQGIFRNGN